MVLMASSVVFVTVPDQKTGELLSTLLVEKCLAACVNRIPGVVSTYRWEGKVQTDKEELLIIKTDKTLVKQVVKAVKENHPAKVPEVISLAIKEGNRDYLRWISDSVGVPRKKQRVPKGKIK